MAHGERRVVGAHGAGADEHGVALGPQAVGVGPGGLGPVIHWLVPSGAAVPAVDGRGELEHDVGPAGAAVDEVRRELLGDGVGLDPDGDLDAGRPQRGDALAGRRAGRGPRSPTTTRRIPAAMIASVHGGVRPWWLHGSSVVTSVAPAAASPARRSASRSACGPPGGWVAPVAMIARA